MDAAVPLKRSGEPLPQFNSLPDTAFHSIFSNLDTWRDAHRLSLTCKQLRDIGVKHLNRNIGCLNCCAPIVSATVAHDANVGSRSISFRLDDGEAMCIGEPEELLPNAVKYDEEGPCTSQRLIRELIRQHIAPTSLALGLKVRQAYCSQCNLYLGVQITEIKGLRAGADLDMSSWRLGLVLGNVFCCYRYLCILDSTGENEDFSLPGILWQDFKPTSLYLCAMQRVRDNTDGVIASDFEPCNAVLFDDRAILSKDHWWTPQEPVFPTPVPTETPAGEGSSGEDAAGINTNTLNIAMAPAVLPAPVLPAVVQLPNGNIENGETSTPTAAAGGPSITPAEGPQGEEAWYLNHIDGNVLIDPPLEMELAQGKMTVSRVWCGHCTRVLGWKFIQCLEEGKNINQSGRWGILEKRVKRIPLPQGKKYSRKLSK